MPNDIGMRGASSEESEGSAEGLSDPERQMRLRDVQGTHEPPQTHPPDRTRAHARTHTHTARDEFMYKQKCLR